MSQTITGLDPKEAEFLITFASQGGRILTIEQAREFWGAAAYTANVLGRLERRGWLHRLERGTYLMVPLEDGPDRAWSESALVIAPYLIEPAAIAYWSALHHWHMTKQVPRTVVVQSTSRKHQRRKEILSVPYRFVTVVESKFFGVMERTLDGQPITVTDREKTLVDSADRPDLSGGIAQLAQALSAARHRLDWRRLEAYLDRWPTGSPAKRIGHLVESLDLPFPNRGERLACWRHSLSSGIIALEPGHRTAEGRIVTRWRLRVNVEESWQAEGSREICSAEQDSGAGIAPEARAVTEEALMSELELLGIRYLSRQSSCKPDHVRLAEPLLADLVRQPHARVRGAVIAVLPGHPRHGQSVSAALRRLSPEHQLTLKALYTAAAFLQREYVDRLRPLVGERCQWLPDLLSEDLGLAAAAPPREKLRLLDMEMRYRTGAAVNWMGTYEDLALTYIRQQERQVLWSQ